MLDRLPTLCILAALLAGCSAYAPPLARPVAVAARAGDSGTSWMAPGAKKIDLLYVSDYATNDVDAYSYPQGKLSGVLRGVLRGDPWPAGLCSDNAGNLYIPDSANDTVLEYAHGGTRLVKTLADESYVPFSCAVDPVSGDLAVMDIVSFAGQGGVSIYKRARGLPHFYTAGFVYKYYFGAYDAGGNLYVDASDDVPSEPFAFVELRRGGHALKEIELDQSVAVPGGVGWDGEHVLVADSRASAVYRFAVAGTSGKKAGTTRLRGGRFVTQFVVAGATIAAAQFHGKSFGFWNYPGGGSPVERIEGLREPFGIALSAAPK
ncbi:MAG TPA: hypothetical protein VMU38_05190 [Candidatus Binatia bacterium]|nr:hypothetical protein [Candidatus Binatia bacterium]